MKKVSDQIREAILKADVSRYELAKVTGVSQSTLSRFVRGDRAGLSFDALDRIGLYLGLKITPNRPRRPTRKKEK